ncbi:hypothetical protein BH11PSE4_BH11PSE4_43820 [soil metagenome]
MSAEFRRDPATLALNESGADADPCQAFVRSAGRGVQVVMNISLVLAFCMAVAGAALTVPAKADVEKFMVMGEGRMHPVFRLKFTPPAGWQEDAVASKKHGAPIYVPAGKSFGEAPAIMYIRVTYNSDNRSLDRFIDVAHEEWRASVKEASIDQLAGETRSNGQPAFRVYHFVNPDNPQQAYELMAYGEDNDNDGNHFTLMIGLSAATQQAIDGATADFRAALRAH